MTDIAIPRGSDAANRIVQKVTGPYRKPQNTGEEFAEIAGRFVPAAVMGPGNVVRNAVAYGVILALRRRRPGRCSRAVLLSRTRRKAAEDYRELSGPWARCPHQGRPILDSGRIFPVIEESITCAPFEILDHFYRLGAMDFGWDHPFAAVELAWDAD